MRLPAQLLQRKADSHKNDFGHVLILAGCARFLGAVALSAKSALRSGAGLVSVGVPKSLNAALQKKLACEIMSKPLSETKDAALSSSSFLEINKFLKGVDVLAVGPGLSQNPSTQNLIRKIIGQIDLPMVIDADALNALIGHLNLLRVSSIKNRGSRILTPHPGEMARMLNTSTAAIQKNRENIAKIFAKKYNVIVVLKGHKTVVASPAAEIYINKTGNPGMATAGSGDVLTGIITSFLAQGLNAFDAAKYGVYIHGLAGDLAAKEKGEIGLIASDIVEKIPQALLKSSS